MSSMHEEWLGEEESLVRELHALGKALFDAIPEEIKDCDLVHGPNKEQKPKIHSFQAPMFFPH